MMQAGADLIVAHAGLTTAGSIGATTAPSLDAAIDFVMQIAETCWAIRPDQLVICHGGPFDEPANVARAMARMPGIAGFYGASSAERLPVEKAITAQIAAFKAMRPG
jgi:predicted TIM-barrel enzyme